MKTLLVASMLAISLPALALANGPDGLCSPADAAQLLCFETTPGYVVEAICGPNGEFPVIDAMGNSVFAYQITGPGSNGNSCANVMNVSHASLKIPVCTFNGLTIVGSSPTITHAVNGSGDPSCGFGVGDTSVEIVKWDVEVPCDTFDIFSVTFAGVVEAAATEFQMKDGNDCRTNMILGPACDDSVITICEGTSGCPCGNNDPAGGSGCANSTGIGGILGWSGSTSVAADDLTLHAVNLPTNESALFLMARNTGPVMNTIGGGLLCLGGPMNKIIRLLPVTNTGANGSIDLGPGIVNLSCNGSIVNPMIGCITSGTTWNFQLYFRDTDPNSPCSNANTTNALSATFTN
ncbi:MAG: hypothetical protein ACI8QC_003329 [Planctomycetota bacterium]|jgi:hypothetical protein